MDTRLSLTLQTAKMRRHAERAQQAKLASLKEWSHIDACKPSSIENLKDNLLYNLVRDDYTTFSKAESSRPEKKQKRNASGDSTIQVANSTDESEFESEVESTGRRKRAESSKSNGIDLGDKKHNLRDLAESNQAGRILFIFEKLSKSQL